MITRRKFLGMSAASMVGVSLGGFSFFRGTAIARVPEGQMNFVAGTPNPHGGFDQLFWCACDPLGGPLKHLTANSAPLPGVAKNNGKSLRVFHFNDLHNHLTLPHKKKGDTHTFSQMVRIVEAKKAMATPDEACLFFSGGDDHTGSIFDELIGWSTTEYVVDPSYAVYTAAGVDGVVLGNHELDRGSQVLAKGIQDSAAFPVLTANFFGSRYLQQGVDYFPAAIGVVKGLRVGLIGLTTPVDTHTGTEEDPGLGVGSPVQAIQNLAPLLSQYVDCLLVLSHCGYGLSQSKTGKAGAQRYLGEGDKIIAKALDECVTCPAMIIGGHTHTALNKEGVEDQNQVGKVTILQAGGHGKYLGEAVMDFSGGPVSAQLYSIKKRDRRVQPGDEKYNSFEQDEDYDQRFEAAEVAPLLAKVHDRLEMVIGNVTGNPDVTTESVVARRYTGELALANYMNDALVARSQTFPGGAVDFTLFNATGFASGIPAEGSLKFADWYNVMPFADSVVIANVTGRQIREILTSNAKRIVRPEELDGAEPLKLGGYISRGFLHFSKGIRYTIKLGVSAADATATDIELDGTPINDILDKTFRLGMNSYIAAGGYGESWNNNPIGGGVPQKISGYDLKKLDKTDTGLVYRNEVVAFIKQTVEISPRNGCVIDNRLEVSA